MARTIVIVFCLLLGAATPAVAQQSPATTDDDVFQQVQKQFAEAYNRKDVNAMASYSLKTVCGLRPAGSSAGGMRSAATCKKQ
jgi:hypothetical protein